MKFSILIPVYNTEKYLDDCLRSVLAQTCGDFEIILVDDGSTDNSPAICDAYAKDHPEIVKVIHKENAGLISARRIGIREAAGEYCIFVDSDDSIEKNTLEVLSFELQKSPDVDVLLYSFKYVSNGVPYKSFRKIADDGKVWCGENKSELYEKLIFSNDVTPMWIKAVRTSLAKSDPTDYTHYFGKNMAEDKLQSLYLLTAADKVKYVCAPLYLYTYNDQSISRNYSIDSIRKMNTVHVYEKIVEYLPRWGMDSDESLKRLTASWFDGTMYLFGKAYASCATSKDRETVLNFDWDSMIPCLDVESYNEYVGDYSLKLYRWLKNKKSFAIRWCFLKKRMYRKLKVLKNKQ